MNKKLIYPNFYFLLFAMLFSGLLSVYFGKELSWDLANYHYYGPYAFFHARQSMDFWPNTYVHQYINPTLDFLSYFLISDFTPRMAEFILGAIHGINIWLIFLIARLFIHGRFQLIIATGIALFSMYAPTVLPGIGSFSNDNLIASFILGFILLQLMTLENYKTKGKWSFKLIFISGLLLGIGFGLKLTAGIYIASAFITSCLLPVPIHDRIKIICCWGIAALLGLFFSAGYWMILMWQQHHNPIFPFLNTLFQSPDFPLHDWRDIRFLPKDIWQTLFYPFYFAWDGRIADNGFRDFRLAIVYLLFVLAGIHWLWKRPAKISLAAYWLFAFCIFSYVIWQLYFSIARYIVTLEMLSPLIIFLLLMQLFTTQVSRLSSCFIVAYLLLFSMMTTPMIRIQWYDSSFFDLKLPDSVSRTPNATVLMAYSVYSFNRDPRPQQYLIPLFPAQWHFIGIPFQDEKYAYDAKTATQILAQIDKEKNQLYLLTSDSNMPELYRIAKLFNLVPHGNCEKIISDRQLVTHQDTLLCPVVNIQQ